MAVKSTNTQVEVLTSILGDISVAKTLPDADLQFLVELETMVLAKLREPMDQAAGQLGPGGPAVPPPPGAPPGMEAQAAMPPAMPPAGMEGMPIPPPPGQQVPGLRNAGPSPDELSRLMG